LDGDHGRNWDTRRDVGCASVEFFAKIH
jgi:hypothetical protein